MEDRIYIVNPLVMRDKDIGNVKGWDNESFVAEAESQGTIYSLSHLKKLSISGGGIEITNGSIVRILNTEDIEGEFRIDSFTGLKIQEGFVFRDGDLYIGCEIEALEQAKREGFKDLDASYKEGNHYWTDWY